MLHRVQDSKVLRISKSFRNTTALLKTYNRGEQSTLETDAIDTKRGMFQGNAIRTLWFCLSLNALNNTRYGFDIKAKEAVSYKLNHLMYYGRYKSIRTTATQMKNLIISRMT